MSFVDKLFGNKSEKEIKRIEKYVDAIEALDEKMQALSDEELRAKTQEFKDRLAAGRLWMIFFQRHLQLSERQQSVYLVWSITGYS